MPLARKPKQGGKAGKPLADKIASLLQPKPKSNFDIEDAGFGGAAVADAGDFDDIYSDEEEDHDAASTRKHGDKRRIKLESRVDKNKRSLRESLDLESLGTVYSGRKISRDQLKSFNDAANDDDCAACAVGRRTLHVTST